jgi:hypothetical protein
MVAALIVYGEALPFSGGAVESWGGFLLIEEKVVAPNALCFPVPKIFGGRPSCLLGEQP